MALAGIGSGLAGLYSNSLDPFSSSSQTTTTRTTNEINWNELRWREEFMRRQSASWRDNGTLSNEEKIETYGEKCHKHTTLREQLQSEVSDWLSSVA